MEKQHALVQQSEKPTHWYCPGISSVAKGGQENWTMSDFIKTLGESNQDALAIKIPDYRGFVCSDLLWGMPTWATGIGIMFLRNTEMVLLCSSSTEYPVHHPI